MKKIIIYAFLLSLLSLFSCEDKVELDVPEGPKRLIIDGNMTTLNGPQRIKITKTIGYNNKEENPYVTNANVKITDDQGNIFPLIYTSDGLYETDASIKGIVGNEYTLHIVTEEGKEYKSSAQTMYEITPIDSILYYHQEELLFKDFLEYGYFVAIEFVENGETSGDVYRWKMYVNDSLQHDQTVVESDDQLENGVEFEGTDFVFSDRPLRVGDKVYIEQMAVTPEAAKFWDQVFIQSSNSGGPFDSPPAPIRGNIYNVNDEKEMVLGFFGTENVESSKTIVIQDQGYPLTDPKAE